MPVENQYKLLQNTANNKVFSCQFEEPFYKSHDPNLLKDSILPEKQLNKGLIE